MSNAEALVAVLWPDYPLAAPTACRLLRDGFNTHYLVATSADDYVLRVYRHGWRTDDDIAYELAVLTHLEACGVPVCGPIARRDGTFRRTLATVDGPRVAVLFRCAAGQAPDAADPKVLHAWGRLMAQIHQHTDGFTCPYGRFHLDLDHLIEQPLAVMLPFLAHRPADVAFIQRVAGELCTGLTAQADGLEWGYCHGDFAGNAHQDADGTLRVFDFDCGGPGWRAYDLAVCRLYSDIGGFWQEFCEGYEEVRPITSATRTVIPWFLVTRQLWRIGLFAAHWPRLTGTPADDTFFDQHLGTLRERINLYLPELAVDE